jgi:hypothetical protein
MRVECLSELLSQFVLSVLTLAARVVAEDNTSVAEMGSFITLKLGGGNEFRAFIAGSADAKVRILFVHDYPGISDATQQSGKTLGALGHRSVAVDLDGCKSATSHEEAVNLMQSVERKATGKILQARLEYLSNLAGSWRPHWI